MKKSFSSLYPYLAWWIENHGYIQLGLGNEDDSFLMLVDDGGVCWEDNDSQTVDEALVAAEKYLKEEEFPERFDEETIAEIENGQSK
jgi:hypothetical protein